VQRRLTRGRSAERQVGIPAQFPVKKIGCPSLPAFFWREAGDFDFPFHSHQQSNSPPLRLRSGQTLSHKNRETRTGHPSPVRTFKYWRTPRTLSLRSVVPTLSQRSRKDGAPSIYFTNGKVGYPPGGTLNCKKKDAVDRAVIPAANTRMPVSRRLPVIKCASFAGCPTSRWFARSGNKERYAYCCAPPADALVAFPIASPESTSSTRRFCCRPSGVSLDAMGWVLPNPRAPIELAAIPCWTR
jgi:hypothetical protein